MSNDVVAPPRGAAAEKAVEYLLTLDRLLAEAASPLPADFWAPLERLVAVDDFTRVMGENGLGSVTEGSDAWARNVMSWAEYREGLTRWMSSAPTYHGVIKRIASFADLACLEIEEHHINGERDHVLNTITAYQFDEHGKLCCLRIASAADWLSVAPGV